MLVGNRMMNLIDGQICQLLKPLEPRKGHQEGQKNALGVSKMNDGWRYDMYIYIYIYYIILYYYIYIYRESAVYLP